jgi:hypothetical protein
MEPTAILSPLHSVSFRDDGFMATEGLNPSNVMEYFYKSPFYTESNGAESINEMVRLGTIPPESAGRVDGEIFVLIESNAEARIKPAPPIDGSIYIIQKFRQILNRPRIPGLIFYVISGTIFLAPGLGRLLERHLAKSIDVFDELVQDLIMAGICE